MPTFAFPYAPPFLAKRLQREWNAPLPHLLFHTLHNISRRCFNAEWNAPLPRFRAQNFGGMLDARLLSTLCRSTSELLRTL